MADEERKIIIDEGWKAQVQREKEEARRKAEAAEREPSAAEAVPSGASGDAEEPAVPGEEPEDGAEESLFLALLQSLAAQALYSLGAIAEPGQQKVMVDLRQARYVIDTLMMLRDKTTGNRTPEEEGHLSQALHELQQVYVVRAQQMQESALRQAGVNPQDLGRRQQ